MGVSANRAADFVARQVVQPISAYNSIAVNFIAESLTGPASSQSNSSRIVGFGRFGILVGEALTGAPSAYVTFNSSSTSSSQKLGSALNVAWNVIPFAKLAKFGRLSLTSAGVLWRTAGRFEQFRRTLANLNRIEKAGRILTMIQSAQDFLNIGVTVGQELQVLRFQKN